MFAVNGINQNSYVVVEDKYLPNLVDRSIIDLADRVLSVAVAVVASLGVILAVAMRDYEAALVFGMFGIMAFISAWDVSRSEVGSPRVIKKYRYYLAPPPASILIRRPYIEFPEFKMRPYHPDNRPLDRGVHASIGKGPSSSFVKKEQLDENRHAPVGK